MSGLHSEEAGQGPILVMLHGLFGNVDNFRSIALHLERNLRVVRIDLPGHGLSVSLPELSLEAMADAVLAHLSAAGITHYHLLGHSLGGKVAMAMAGRKHLETRPHSLCVVDIAPKIYPPHHQAIFDALLSLDLETLESRRDADKRLQSTVTDAGIRAFLLKGLYRNEDDQFRWRFDLEQLARDYPLIQRAPVIEQVIRIPALFIKGGASDYLQSEDEPLIKSLFAQPSLKILSGAGHWPHAEKPGQFSTLCQEFVQTNPASAH